MNPNVPDRHSQIFAAGLETADGSVLGISPTSKVALYGANPIPLQTLSLSTATTAQIVQALANLGAVKATT